jgi:hypothetical protein
MITVIIVRFFSEFIRPIQRSVSCRFSDLRCYLSRFNSTRLYAACVTSRIYPALSKQIGLR